MTGAQSAPPSATGAEGEAADVCFVAMPYASLSRPSIALGLLQAILAADGLSATVVHANLRFAETVGLHRYELAASRSPSVFLAGEWTFAGAAFGDDPRRDVKDAEYLRQVHEASERHPVVWRGARGAELISDLQALRDAATRFVDDTARRVLATGARVVGCTSTFEQHVASLALLRRIRELDPGVVTMLGGANCETVMGETTHRCFDWVDYVVSGEADGIIAGLCRLALTQGREADPADLPPGVLGPRHRANRRQRPAALPRMLFSDLDSLPTPTFDDYFATLAASPLAANVRPGLPLETSRGCWWGAVHQCTFCGLNGTSLGFRSKSPDRVLTEIHELQDRYQISDFEAVDNILDMGYYSSLLPALADDGRDRRIFYEIKANLSRAHVQSLVRAGVTWVQPGIESLHSDVLKLMDKGLAGWQNIQLLKWSREFGLRISWSILWGFPGEKDDWYEDMASWLPSLEHLQPPASSARIRYDRYSVYHEQARRRGLILFPIGAMSFVYPVGPADLDNLTYFFATEPAVGPLRYIESLKEEISNNPGVTALVRAARDWGTVYGAGKRPVLTMEDYGDKIAITDTRTCARSGRHLLAGLARAVYLACDAAPRRDKLAAVLARDFGVGAAADHVDDVVNALLADRLVLEIDGRVVSLALPSRVPAYPDYTQFPGGYVSAVSAARPSAPSRPDAESR
jgi:ribosomal peptide maturation radical SAM protein 1